MPLVHHRRGVCFRFEQFFAFDEIRAELVTFPPGRAASVADCCVDRKRTEPIRFLLRNNVRVLTQTPRENCRLRSPAAHDKNRPGVMLICASHPMN